MAFTRFCRGGVVALEKLVECRLFLDLLWRFGIECFHLIQLFLRDLGQMADKMNQEPTVLILFRRTVTPGRHGCEPDAIMNDPEEFAVRHGLCIRQLQIRGFWVHVLADRRFAAAVVAVTGGAMVGKMCTSVL